jgi:adenylate cyclase
MKHKIYQSAVWAILCTIGIYFFGNTPFFQTFENILWDVRVEKLQRAEEHDTKIKLVLIDQSSLDWAKTNYTLAWPWPREMYAKLVDYCISHGAKAVIFDILFQEPSVYGVEDDKRLIDSIMRTNTVGSMVLSQKQGDHREWPFAMLKPDYPSVVDRSMTQNHFALASFPSEAIGEAFGLVGFVNAFPDRDGIIRKTNVVSVFDGRFAPALPLAACLSTQECTTTVDPATRIINYHGPVQTYETINAASIIQAQLVNEAGADEPTQQYDFNQSYVFIGMSAPGLMDLKSTPMERVYPGTEIHATVLDNLLHNDFINMVSVKVTVGLLFIAVFVTFLGIRYHRSMAIGAIYTITLIMVSILLSIGFYYFHFWFNLTFFIIGITGSSVAAFSINYFHEGAQRRFLKNAFSRYISSQVIDELIKHPETLRLGGRKEVLSILFSDIEGFTTLSTQLEAEVLAKFLNEYLGLMSDVILEMGGTIDKYEGDAIIAFWNAPLPQSNHADLAVASVMRCQKVLEEHNPFFEKKYGFRIKTRFGIHTGEVIVGNLGTEKRFDYTFIGDAGNLASRLESANKQFGSMCMISEETKGYLNDDGKTLFRELGTIQVVGRTSAVKVFEPVDVTRADNYREWMDEYNGALKRFYAADFEGALSVFETLAPLDAVSAAYVKLIRNLGSAHVQFSNGTLILGDK